MFADSRKMTYLWTASWSFKFGISVCDPEALPILRWRRLPMKHKKKNQLCVFFNQSVNKKNKLSLQHSNEIIGYLLSRIFFLYSGSLRRFLSKYMQYPRKRVPATPAAIPMAVRFISIFKKLLLFCANYLIENIYFNRIQKLRELQKQNPSHADGDNEEWQQYSSRRRYNLGYVQINILLIFISLHSGKWARFY